MSRKAYGSLWWTRWVLFAAFFAMIAFSNELSAFSAWIGGPYIPVNLIIFGAILLTVLAVIQMRRLQFREAKDRANFDQTIRLKQDDDGLRFITDEMEYYIKWRGISQMLVEPDGIVISHGNLFFLVPNMAFTDANDRREFSRQVYNQLAEKARARSAKLMRAEIGDMS